MLSTMTMKTVDWTALRPQEEPPAAEGLRERKKRLLRRRLSDTATEMFIERGFDAVRVAEVAEACGVSEKTVFNYYPTKESLVLDLGESTLASLEKVLADPRLPAVEAAQLILAEQLSALTAWIFGQPDLTQAKDTLRRFAGLIRSTPSLRAHHRDTTDRQAAAVAAILAARAGLHPGDPEPQIAAAALLALWPIQFQSLHKHLEPARTAADLHAAVTADVHRAARLINTGLHDLDRPPLEQPGETPTL